MGNRGTTPSWDDEQIAKYGIFNHLGFVARHSRSRIVSERKELVAKHIDSVLPLLPSQSEETIAQAGAAIPRVVYTLSMLEVARPNWKQFVASDVYEDQQRRTGKSEFSDFYTLSEEDQQPFIQIVEIVVTAIESCKDPNITAE